MSASLSVAIARAAIPLPDPDASDFADAFDRWADRRVVLLGESSHGTSEFYRARAAITMRLVREHGFTHVCIEADWPDAALVNRHLQGREPKPGAEPPFGRFPTWMWRNAEFARFLGDLRAHNDAAATKVGLYGLDLYSLGASIEAVLEYLDRTDPEAAREARERYGCLQAYGEDPAAYGRSVIFGGEHPCEDAVTEQMRDLLNRRIESEEDPEDAWDAANNARQVAAAERYYRAMFYGGAESWNLRDTHMFETLAGLIERGGKAVVWAHNSHIGDATRTEMGWAREQINLGSLCRDRWGEDAALIGFGTHAGTVTAAHEWGDPPSVMDVVPSREGCVERLCHDAGVPRFVLDLGEDELKRRLAPNRYERFIGVIYRPATEFMSHYAEVSFPVQFDAWVWFDETRAVTPLAGREDPRSAETFPSGL